MKIKLIAKIKDVILGYVFDSGNDITIGREIGNTIAPIIDSISRHHARIFFADGVWKVEDLGSTNGSLVNGQRVQGQVPLKSGDALRFGLIDMTVNFDKPAAPAAAPMPPPAAAPIPALTPAAPKPAAAPALSPISPAAPKPAAPALSPIAPAGAPALEPVADLEPVAELEPVADLKPVDASEPLKPVNQTETLKPITMNRPVFGKRPTVPGGLKLPPKPALKLPPRKA